MREPFGIPSWNLGTCIFVASSISCSLPYCCKCTSSGCTAAIRCDSACHGPRSNSVHSGNEHKEFDPPRLAKHEAGFLNMQWVLIGSNQLWHVNDLPYCRELRLSQSVFLQPAETSYSTIAHSAEILFWTSQNIFCAQIVTSHLILFLYWKTHGSGTYLWIPYFGHPKLSKKYS